jgi:hypothetical protein
VAAAAIVAAASASRTFFSSTTATSVRARPDATPPALRRSAASALTTSLPVVSQSPIMLASTRPSRASISSEARGPHSPARYGSGLVPAQAGLQRVDHPPALLDLGGVREQRAVADQHVEHEPLVRLRAGLGERLAVLEVHRDVADLHRGAGHLRAELEHHALVRLTRMTSWLLPSISTSAGFERQVRRLLEQDRDLGDPARHPLADPTKNGTSAQRRFWMPSRTATYVSVVESGGMFFSSRYPTARSPATQPGRYWPRTEPWAMSLGRLIACSTLSFSARISFGSKLVGLLHPDQREQLQQVVLQHVAGGAGES